MWINQFVRYSKKLIKWPLRVSDQCKRVSSKLSFGPLLFIQNQTIHSSQFHRYDWKKIYQNQRDHFRNDRKNHTRCVHPSWIGSLISAAVLFSWEEDGISDAELEKAAKDEVLLNMTHDDIEEFLSSDGWEKLLRKDHLMLFRKYEDDLEVYSYKIFGIFNDVSPLVFLQVQLDLDYRMKWDDHALCLTVVDTNLESGSDIVHWIQKFPFPFHNRDYLYARRYCIETSENSPEKVIIKCHSINHPAVHPDKKSVRVNKYESSMIIQSKTKLEEKGMKFLLTYHEDAKASMPSSTYSYLAQSGIPSFVEKLHVAAKKLPKSKIRQLNSIPPCCFKRELVQ